MTDILTNEIKEDLPLPVSAPKQGAYSQFAFSVDAQGNSLPTSGFGQSPTTTGRFGGDGSDGPLSITSGTTTINLAGAAIVTKNYSSITITGTGKLAFSNPNAAGTFIVLKSLGNVILTSTASPGCIDVSTTGGSGGAGGTGGAGDGSAGTGNNTFIVKTNAGGGGTNAAHGSDGAAATLNIAQFNQYQSKYLITFIGAGGGGGASNHADSTGGSGGTGGGGLVIECGGDLNFPSTATIYATGVDGANGVGTAAAGGGGGGGGCVYIIYKSTTSKAGTIDTSRGESGTGTVGAPPYGGGGGASITASPGASGSTGSPGGAGASLVVQNTELP